MNPQTGGQLVIALKLNTKEITPSYCRARRFAAPFCTKDTAMPPSAHSIRPPRELKKDRIELRVAGSAKELIQRAMAVSG